MARQSFEGSAEIDRLRRALTELEFALMPDGQELPDPITLQVHLSTVLDAAQGLGDVVERLSGGGHQEEDLTGA